MTPIFYQCTVLDNNDPLMLGRIRAKINIINLPDVLKGVTAPKWNEEKDIWTERDPLIFYPLLPYFLYQVPKKDELIQVIFVNPEFKFQNQYYVQSNFFSVNSIYNTNGFGGSKFTGTGMQFKAPRNIKNQNGTWPAKSVEKGIYPEPGDNAILGRGSADLIVKETDLLLRAGKFSEPPQSNLQAVPNNNRSFLQLSIFPKTRVSQKTQKFISSTPITLSVRYLIEWVINNPENTQDKFNGAVYLYSLKESVDTNTKNISVSTNIPLQNKFLVYSEEFQLLSLDESIKFINTFIKTCNDKNVSSTGKKLFSDNQNKFPIFFRPAKFSYDFIVAGGDLNSNEMIAKNNLTTINNQIKLLPSDEAATADNKFGLIWKQNTTGLPIEVKITDIETPTYETTPRTIAALGGQEIYLLSQYASIEGKGKINFADSIYGIPESAFTQDIQSKTSSSVRGEELLELLNLIYQFLITHTHAFPGLPPVPVTQSGIDTATISTEMQNAATKILNKYIRLN